jgi:glycine/sarcosine N-methyltransferase
MPLHCQGEEFIPMDQFCSDFASHWDELVGWEQRSAADASFLLGLIQKFKCQKILDVALGTGFDSIKLLREGLQVTSVDISQAMIDVAKQNAARYSVQLDVICADWAHLTQSVSGKFDCVVCVGNSLACEMDSQKRQLAVTNWTELLSDDGVIILDRRNYEALLNGEYNVESKGQYFGETVKIAFSKITSDETVFSYTFSDGRTFDLKMFPILDGELKSIFSNAGLKPVEIYGDRKLSYHDKKVAFYLYVFRKIKNA